MRVYAQRLRRRAQGRPLAADRGRPGRAPPDRRRPAARWRRACRCCRRNRADVPWDERRSWQRYWLVDPLDGTREFVKKQRRVHRQHRADRGRRAGARRGLRAGAGRAALRPCAASAPSCCDGEQPRAGRACAAARPRRCASPPAARTWTARTRRLHRRAGRARRCWAGLLAEVLPHGRGARSTSICASAPTSRMGHRRRAVRARGAGGAVLTTSTASRCATTSKDSLLNPDFLALRRCRAAVAGLAAMR